MTCLKAPPVTVRASSTLAVGERVYTIGAPEGLELSLSEGLICGLREFEQVRLIQTSAAISPGSSGGGLFDTQGRLVGITTFFLKEGQNLNFALPGEWVQALATRQFTARQRTETDSPAFQALQWFQLGYAAYDVGEYEKAVRAYREVVRLEPDYAEAWNNLGVASCESFMKTLKREEIYANRYDDLEHLRTNIEEFIEQYYNRQQLHSALGYRSPEEFERQSESQSPAMNSRSATMQFFENDGNGENEKGVSTELSGEGDSIAVPFPRPLLLLGDARKTE